MHGVEKKFTRGYGGASNKEIHMDDKTKELVRSLNQPHRVANMLALFKMCEQAATIIQAQASEIAALNEKAPAMPAPKRVAKKAD